MEKFSSAGIVRGWAGRSSRGLRAELCQCWASSMVREMNWKLIDPCLWGQIKQGAAFWGHLSWLKVWGLLTGPRQAEFLCPGMVKGICGEQKAAEWTCCNFKSPLWSPNWIIMVEQSRQQFFFHRIDFCKLQSYGYIFSLEWLEMHLPSCWDFTIKTSPSLWHYSWLLQVREKERWLQHYQHISIKLP